MHGDGGEIGFTNDSSKRNYVPRLPNDVNSSHFLTNQVSSVICLNAGGRPFSVVLGPEAPVFNYMVCVLAGGGRFLDWLRIHSLECL